LDVPIICFGESFYLFSSKSSSYLRAINTENTQWMFRYYKISVCIVMYIFIINIKNIFRIHWSYWQTSIIIVHSYVDVVLIWPSRWRWWTFSTSLLSRLSKYIIYYNIYIMSTYFNFIGKLKYFYKLSSKTLVTAFLFLFFTTRSLITFWSVI